MPKIVWLVEIKNLTMGNCEGATVCVQYRGNITKKCIVKAGVVYVGQPAGPGHSSRRRHGKWEVLNYIKILKI